MKCEDCKNISKCKDKRDNPSFYGCTSGVPSNPIIKPCPFCGKEPNVIKNICEKNGYIGYYVFHDCFLLGHSIRSGLRDSEKEAIGMWNNRKA